MVSSVKIRYICTCTRPESKTAENSIPPGVGHHALVTRMANSTKKSNTLVLTKRGIVKDFSQA